MQESFSGPLIVRVFFFPTLTCHLLRRKEIHETRWYLSERSALSWQLLSAACEWWLNQFLVCQDEQGKVYFDINTDRRIWWRGAVNLFDLFCPLRLPPERYFAGQILSWACRYWCGVGKLILKFHIQGVSSCPPASSPCVIQEMLLHLSDTEASEDTEKLHRLWAFACLHVNLMDNLSVILSPFRVGLRGLFTMHEPWVNEFIAHVVNRHRQKAFNKPQCPVVLHELRCSGCFTGPFLSKVIACRPFLLTISFAGNAGIFLKV